MKPSTSLYRPKNSAFSLIEMLVVISVLGIVASVGIAQFGKINAKGKEAIARNLTEKLNRGVRSFSHANWEMGFNPIPTSGGDEILVLRSLQFRDPVNPAHESPYFRNDWNPTTSNDVNDYRIEWTGSAWKLLVKGDTGYGLKIRFDASDIGDPFVFPSNFTPVGSR